MRCCWGAGWWGAGGQTLVVAGTTDQRREGRRAEWKTAERSECNIGGEKAELRRGGSTSKQADTRNRGRAAQSRCNRFVFRS